MLFGLCSATASFQRLMAQALNSVTKKYGNLVMCYVDDVVIATPTLADHIERLHNLFACMKRAGLRCKSSKCDHLKDSMKYLGRMIAWQLTRSTCSRSSADLEVAKNRTSNEGGTRKERGDEERVVELVGLYEEGELRKRLGQVRTPLHRAARYGQLASIKQLVQVSFSLSLT